MVEGSTFEYATETHEVRSTAERLPFVDRNERNFGYRHCFSVPSFEKGPNIKKTTESRGEGPEETGHVTNGAC